MPVITFKRGRYGDKTYTWDADIRHVNGRWKCRTASCTESSKAPFRFYCGRAHKDEFEAWLLAQAPPHWGDVRAAAIARDGARCTRCKDGPGSPQDQRDEQRLKAIEAYRQERLEHYQREARPDGKWWEDLKADIEVQRQQREAGHIRERRRQRCLEVDHIRPVAKYPELEFELTNLRTLCHACHAATGARPNRKQWRAANAPGQRRLNAVP